MKFVPVFFIVVSLIQVAYSIPVNNEETDSNIHLNVNIPNADLSQNYSKFQAPTDGHNSEWSNTQQNEIAHRNVTISQMDQKEEKAGLLIYAGGNAGNLALAQSGSESQAAENDQNSSYNVQSMGLESLGALEYEEDQTDE